MKKRVNYKIVSQLDQSDCGVACLASIVKHYRGSVSLERLRDLSGTSIQGTTLLGLYQAAQHIGLDAEGLEADCIDNLKEISAPVILHVKINNNLLHYFVFYGIENDKFVIGDPAKGIAKYSGEELDKVWESKALLKLTPNKDFETKERSNKEKRKWIIELAREDFNLLLVGLFFGVLIAVLGLATVIFSQKLIDNILPSGNQLKLLLSLVLLMILLLARSGLSYLRGFFIIHQSKDFNNRIIQQFYNRLLHLPISFFNTRKTGELIARMNDTRRIQTVITFIAGNIVIDLLLLIVSLGFVFYYSLSLGFLLLASVPTYFLIIYFFNNKIINNQKEVMSSYAFTESHYVDTIQGIGTIKATNQEDFFCDVNHRVYDTFQQKIFSLGKLNVKFGWLSEIIGIVFLISIFGLSSWFVLKKSLQLGEMVALLSMVGAVIPAINRLAIANIQIQEALVAFDRMFEFTSMRPEYVKEEKKFLLGNEINVKLTNVSFRFPGRKQLLSNISLEVKHGEIIALLGESGSGKSTLMQLIQKFYSPEAGNIQVNNFDLSSIPTNEWRGRIGVVPQDIKIFNGNLLYNITLSENREDYEKAINLCQQYGLHNYFDSFPQSYLTLLGEEGINISGGQRQLVALMRSLFSTPKILLLDEPTSAMDKRTENFVLNLLLTLKNEISIILVTHRVKIAQFSDRIYILENGIIKNSGSPKELLRSKNLFSESVIEQNYSV